MALWVRRACALPVMRRTLLCISRAMSGRESCNAGQRPNTTAVETARAILKNSTGTFILITDSAGKEPCGRNAVIRERRSEEHTSELQSLTNLVCRLLLEK